jgi:transcriptional regulator with XRE-family HTH domain
MSGHIAGRITKLREESGMSQRALAAAADVPQTILSRIEAGSRPARIDEVMALAWAMGHSVDAILDEHPLSERVLVAARASMTGADAASVKSRLTYFLEVDAYMDLEKVAVR